MFLISHNTKYTSTSLVPNFSLKPSHILFVPEELVDDRINFKKSKEGQNKRSQLIQRREDIVREIENHDIADDKFSECLVNLVELASEILNTFKGSTIEKKRNLT